MRTELQRYAHTAVCKRERDCSAMAASQATARRACCAQTSPAPIQHGDAPLTTLQLEINLARSYGTGLDWTGL